MGVGDIRLLPRPKTEFRASAQSSYVTTFFNPPASNLLPIPIRTIMNFSWSTPLRRNGQSDLPLIPNEIYLHIFESIAPPDQPLSEEYVQTFSALALVCRFFCSVALPRVFERVTFSGNGNGNRTLASRSHKWARQIVTNIEPAKSLALYVKECTFERWQFNKELKWVLFAFANLYCQALGRMSNIQKVVFSASFVKTDHWDALAELKQLDVLEFHSCVFIEDPPDKELTVRTVMLFGSHRSPRTPLTLRPIATTSLRSLMADDVEAVLNVAAFRQLAIDDLVLVRQISYTDPLYPVFQHLPGLQSITLRVSSEAPASWLTSKLSLKKLFTRLHSFTIKGTDFFVRWYDIKLLVNNLCGGPGTLPSLEQLNIYLVTTGKTTTLDTIYDCLNGTIVPAFPNVRCIKTDAGFMRLEEGNWKKHYSN